MDNFKFFILFCLLATLSCKNRSVHLVGYSDKKSYKSGEEQTIYLSSNIIANHYPLKLFDAAGNQILERSIDKIEHQEYGNKKPWEEGFGWKSSAHWKTPKLPSGVYYWEGKIPFVVLPESPKEVTVLVDFNTAEAYNYAGGKNLYSDNNGDKKQRARIVSFQRPLNLSLPRHSDGCLKYFAQKKYDFNYLADMDFEDENYLKNSKLLIIIGHSEYWSRKMRENLDSYVDRGGNVLLLSGNNIWWQVRYSDDRTKMICYRYPEEDPIDNFELKTIVWLDSKLNYPIISSIGSDFRHGGFGTSRESNETGHGGYKVTDHSHPIFDETGVKNGDLIKFYSDELDGTPESSFRGFHKSQTLGFEYAFRGKKNKSYIYEIQKSPASGHILAIPSTNICDQENAFDGESAETIKKIIDNAIAYMLKK